MYTILYVQVYIPSVEVFKALIAEVLAGAEVVPARGVAITSTPARGGPHDSHMTRINIFHIIQLYEHDI